MGNFEGYVKKQLLEYVESERKKGVPLEVIEEKLRDAGHEMNIIDEVMYELKEREIGRKIQHRDTVENDLIGKLKRSFSSFVAKASDQEISEAKEKLGSADTNEIIEKVIDEAEVIEEKIFFEGITFFIYLVIFAIIIFASASATDSGIVKVILSFLPAIFNAFISFAALNVAATNVPLFVMIPLAISTIFYVVGRFSGLELFEGLDVEALAIINFFFSFVFNILMVYIRFLKPEHMKKRVIKKRKKPPVPPSEYKQWRKKRKKEWKNKFEEKEEIEDLREEFNLSKK